MTDEEIQRALNESLRSIDQIKNDLAMAESAALRKLCATAEFDALRAKLAEATARAEKAEAELAVWADKDGNSPGYNHQKARTYGTIAHDEREARKKAEAACAELRAALEKIIAETSLAFAVAKANRALSRTDLGAGKVLVEREVVIGTRDALRIADRLRRLAVKVVCLPRSIVDSVEAPASLLQAIDDLNRDEADFVRWEGKLDALLKKGGG